MTEVNVVVPDAIHDPLRPSGGNVYDRHVCRGLAVAGWTVREHAVPGRWPFADMAAQCHLADVLRAFPDGGLVLMDGLVASANPEVLVPEAERVRLVILVHMPLGEASPGARQRERAVLSAAASVVTTSRWTRQWLRDRYQLPGRIHVAEPGAEVADLAPGSDSGGELLCVGAVTPGKGHDVLVDALAEVKDLAWRCLCVGSLELDRRFVDRVRRQAEDRGVADGLRFTGPLTGADLGAVYAGSDLLVLPSRAETYGMVLTEALARGIPVVTSGMGGVPEALGGAVDAPGLLVRPGDAAELAAALGAWLSDGDLRQRLRRTALRRRSTLSGWSHTSSRLADALVEAGRSSSA